MKSINQFIEEHELGNQPVQRACSRLKKAGIIAGARDAIAGIGTRIAYLKEPLTKKTINQELSKDFRDRKYLRYLPFIAYTRPQFAFSVDVYIKPN